MSGTEFDLETLRQASSKETRKSELADLDPELFDRVAEATAGGVDEEHLCKLTTELVDRRVGKIVKLASFAAADMRINRDGLTPREAELLEDLRAPMEEYRAELIPDAGGDSDGE